MGESGEVVGCLQDGVRWGSGLCIYIAQSHLWKDIFSPLLCTVAFVTNQYMSVSAHLRSLPLAYWTVIVRIPPVSFLVSLRWVLTSSRVISSSRLPWATSALLACLFTFRITCQCPQSTADVCAEIAWTVWLRLGMMVLATSGFPL